MVASGYKLAPLSPDKLLISLYKSCQHRPRATNDASALAETCLAKIQRRANSGVIARSEIAEVASEVLARFDAAASVHYRAFHENSV